MALDLKTDEVTGVLWHNDDRILVTTCIERRLTFWDALLGKELYTITTLFRHRDLAKAENLMITVGENFSITFFNSERYN
jgi:hypothetical protein